MAPTKCSELVAGWPNFVVVKDVSGHSVGDIIVGENEACTPTMSRFKWPAYVKAALQSGPETKGKLKILI